MEKTFWNAIKNRRSIYALGDEKIVSEEKIKEIVTDALLHTPSPFNSQSTRVVLLFNEEHRKFWQITLDELKKKVSPEQFEQTTNKINGSFAAGYGTVLFYEEKQVNEIITTVFEDYCTLRRDMISEGIMKRDGATYIRIK